MRENGQQLPSMTHPVGPEERAPECCLSSRVQRFAMLHLLDFHEKLLNALCQRTEGSPTTEHAQSLILDILCWLAGVYSNESWRYKAHTHTHK